MVATHKFVIETASSSTPCHARTSTIPTTYINYLSINQINFLFKAYVLFSFTRVAIEKVGSEPTSPAKEKPWQKNYANAPETIKQFDSNNTNFEPRFLNCQACVKHFLYIPSNT